MPYKSTRGGCSGLSFSQAVTSGYAPDGGLLVPEHLPKLSAATLTSWRNLSFPDLAAEVIALFADDEISISELRKITSEAYGPNSFQAEGALPLKPVDLGDGKAPVLVLETFWGPTGAFKDIGLQTVCRLLDYFLAKQRRHAHVLVETSGDTGPAALAGCRGLSNVDIFCLFPKDRCSQIQELQMTTVIASNVHVYQTEGNTDDQANMLKDIFSDGDFVSRYTACSINSINFARVAVQSSYYIYTYLRACPTLDSPPPVFVVPTGAFGNCFGGYLAKRMGLPIAKIVAATNRNDIVHRAMSTGDWSLGDNMATLSPAMDIQMPYNLERLLFYCCNEQPGVLAPLMQRLEASGRTSLDPLILQSIAETFESVAVTDAQTIGVMSSLWQRERYAVCPHSAIGIQGAISLRQTFPASAPVVCVATAHVAKFEDAFRQATGQTAPSTPRIDVLRSLPTRFKVLKRTPEWRADWARELKSAVAELAGVRQESRDFEEAMYGQSLPTAPTYPVQAVRAAALELGVDKLVEALAEAFAGFVEGDAQVPPISHLTLGHGGDACIKAASMAKSKFWVVKVASGGFKTNVGLGFPSNSGLMLLFSRATGRLEATLADEGYLTELRTAAVGALAAKMLAPRGVECVGIIGTGVQARFQAKLLLAVTGATKVYIWGRTPSAVLDLKADLDHFAEVEIASSVKEVLYHCRVVVTVTASREPLVEAKDVHPGTHLTCVGADAPGKQEVDDQLLRIADLVVADSVGQCAAFGECAHAVRAGALKTSDIVELGNLVQDSHYKLRRGGGSDDRITLFDSTGVAVTDAAIAEAVLVQLQARHPRPRL